MWRRLRNLGPGLMVAAAFIGPGTVTTASVAGAGTGYALLWALVFSIAATMVLQEMSARLGIVSREGLGDALRSTFDNPAVKIVAIVLIVSAIGVGAAAFETGNITGAGSGLASMGGSQELWSLIIGVLAFALLSSGAYRLIERVLVALVIVMSVVFLVTAAIVRPDLGAVVAGILTPGIPDGSLVTAVALIGTTVVTYNFFLHSSSVQDKWPEEVPTDQAVSEARFDTTASVALGGLITLAIMVTAASAFYGTDTEIETAADMAVQLEPLLGSAAKVFFAVGLLAAGLTSAVTAPLAAAYATAGAFGWGRDLSSWRFRLVWMAVIVFGTTLAASVGASPTQIIIFAQAANGLMLPVVAVFLLIVMNRSDLLGRYKNGIVGNALGGIVVLVALFLGGRTLWGVITTLVG
jgi:manganese transport protein